jgi:hypothetical protein
LEELTLAGNWIHGWAFVELTEHAADRFFRPNIIPQILTSHLPDEYGFANTILPLAGIAIEDFGDLEKGRTTLLKLLNNM